MFIDGAWTPAADAARMDLVDPATEEKIDSVPVATPQDLDRALAAAERGFKAWRETDAWTRSAALRKAAEIIRDRAEEFARTLTDEQGKPLAEARAEVRASADQFDWNADEARRIYGRVIDGHSRAQRLLVVRQPIGPVAAFSPWNFPSLLPARKIAPALAAGCSIIVKPAEEAPRSALLLAQACAEAGVPAGAVNVVTGNPSQISRHLIASPIVRKVSLTGSVPVGRALLHLCAEQVKPVTMELGGHAPVLVFLDADVEKAAETCARGKFRNNGQVCIAASRFFVHEEVAERFTARFVETVRALRVGDGREEGVDVGPLSNRRRLDAVRALIEDAVKRGAHLRAGGDRPKERPRGFFFQPTVLSQVDASMRVMNEEPFGPVAPIATFRTMDEALARANSTDYGLAGYVFTRDTRTAFLASEGLEVGMVGVNRLVIATAEAPFGGVKSSGYGREGGIEGIEGYTITKYINVGLE
jgi:succinate-semialdehyde dehydrogenase/glutarate-semialdehyde dehydrogenase